MALEKQIMEEMKAAMKSKDKTALEALRAIKSAILLAKTDGSGSELSQTDEIAILQKQIKLRKDAAAQFAEQGRNEMAENELAQASVIEKFLPEQLSAEELEAEIAKIVEETGATEMKDMGKVMKLSNERLAGKADSKAIADAVKNKLGK
ncbi:GatB/YqeY domain-containing protein [Ornithobacterium rhinotracheale]|uniref:GatB/YqeY domain-containing protein n=1 Tax=Ornithobacterium rhinotracheale TaxID=28251 RepID=A0A410JPL4_ORNRH|nr:GatB/YqeY domain-containing protein [Ornithobacterium rhinotracheale]QAR30072.1 GatB/YqeY domain-containing protein [Ornithobacterium rhinotracheale]